ncbi:unnamed protein product [Leptidea sinapis]|uniref:Uncharacterized protein n=1 Tax=Leptidea sinapis TaxID=189913 RepID=A0A5E4PX81_9NEOP|nr:unnamed protein product [Leptidea sinapis]
MGIKVGAAWSVLVSICLVDITNVATEYTDQDLLQQALLLVDLLKAEYSRVQKENIILRIKLGHCRNYSYQTANRVPNRRQLDYEDGFGEHPNSTLSTATDSSKATTKNTSTVATTATSTPAKASTPSTKPFLSSFTPPTSLSTTILTPPNTQSSKSASNPQEKVQTSKSTGTKVKLRWSKTSSPTNTEKYRTVAISSATENPRSRDPVMEQVASEIVNEVKDFSPAGKISNIKDKRFQHLRRGTTRIYLATSTRYAIPLPENNAFCFFHPESGLCRTLI